MNETLYSHLLHASYLIALPQRSKSTLILFEVLLDTVDIPLGFEIQTQIKQRYSISSNIRQSFLLVYNTRKNFCIFFFSLVLFSAWFLRVRKGTNCICAYCCSNGFPYSGPFLVLLYCKIFGAGNCDKFEQCTSQRHCFSREQLGIAASLIQRMFMRCH